MRVLVLSVCLSAVGFAQASEPEWWARRGVKADGHGADHHALANQGQLKLLTVIAFEELKSRIPAAHRGADFAALETLVQGLNNAVPEHNYMAVNQGQAKNIAVKIYDVLIEIQYCSAYPWNASPNPPAHTAAVNQGQLKNLFNFDLTIDGDTDKMPDWLERLNGFDPEEEDENNNGTLDGLDDADNDGRSNFTEARDGTNPYVPDPLAPDDHDGDGMSLATETATGRDPQWPDHPAIGLTVTVIAK